MINFYLLIHTCLVRVPLKESDNVGVYMCVKQSNRLQYIQF